MHWKISSITIRIRIYTAAINAHWRRQAGQKHKNCMPIDKKLSSVHCQISGCVIILDEKLLGSHLSSRAMKYGTSSFSILEIIKTLIFDVHANFNYMASETSERIFIKWEYTQFII